MPLFLWPAIAVLCLIAIAEWDCWRINRQRDNSRAVEAERIARQNAHPLGNVSRGSK